MPQKQSVFSDLCRCHTGDINVSDNKRSIVVTVNLIPFIFNDREAGEIIVWYHPSVSLCISRSIQNGWAFKMVAVSTGCAIAVDYAFKLYAIVGVIPKEGLAGPCL